MQTINSQSNSHMFHVFNVEISNHDFKLMRCKNENKIEQKKI